MWRQAHMIPSLANSPQIPFNSQEALAVPGCHLCLALRGGQVAQEDLCHSSQIVQVVLASQVHQEVLGGLVVLLGPEMQHRGYWFKLPMHEPKTITQRFYWAGNSHLRGHMWSGSYLPSSLLEPITHVEAQLTLVKLLTQLGYILVDFPNRLQSQSLPYQ